MADMQNNTTQTAEYEQTKHSNKRKLTVVALLCLLCIVLLLIGLSRAKYRTPEMRGQGDYEPALFNTVLLGELTDTDVKELKSLDNQDTTGYTQKITGKKLSKSLHLTVNNEIRQGNYSGIKPGASMEIPFTVTNGTTITDDEKNTASNVAQSDIRYKVYIRTTQNLPLTYSLRDLDENKIYSMKLNNEMTDSLGKAKEYILDDTADQTSGAKVFDNGYRILRWTGDDSITVHRYELQVNWERGGTMTDADGMVIQNTDTRYMKEIENIEVRLEIESYVNYANPTVSDTDIVSGVLTLKASDNDTYYTTPSSMGTIHSQKTVRYDNFGSKQATDVPSGVASDGKKVYAYSFSVENGEGMTWDAASESYKKTSTSYSGMQIAIAVPTGKSETEAGVGTNMTEGVNYYLEYDGDTYQGIVSNDKVTTEVWVKDNEKDLSENNPGYVTETAYQVIYFSKADNTSLQMNFAKGFESKELKLYMVTTDDKYSYGKQENKDDFRIYVYK